MNTQNEIETIYNMAGEKVGVVVHEGIEWVAYNLSDIEICRNAMYSLVAWSLND